MRKASYLLRAKRDVNFNRIRRLRNKIKLIERSTDMTAEDRNNAYHLYRKLVTGYKDLDRRTKVTMDNQDSYALPIIRRQLNSILHKEKGTTFLHFTEELHGNALRGYTRSGIPHPGDYNVEKVLNSIKQGLQEVLTNEEKPLTR